MVQALGAKSLLNAVHGRAVFDRRVRVLSQAIAGLIPGGGRVLDLGCGDGSIAAAVMAQRSDLGFEGVDVLIRPQTRIPVTRYDGVTLPFADGTFDFVTIIDVLHHTDDPGAVLAEAARVARRAVILKDHLREGALAGPTLRFMDWVGNRGHDVRLPYNYLDSAQWRASYARARLVPDQVIDRLSLYPQPFSALFDRRLHILARLIPTRA